MVPRWLSRHLTSIRHRGLLVGEEVSRDGIPESRIRLWIFLRGEFFSFPTFDYSILICILCFLLQSGIGTYQDTREALDWFRKAASHGDKRALDRLRTAGQPLPAQVPTLRNTPSSNALSSNNYHSLPSKNRQASSNVLSKNKQQQPLPPQPQTPRSHQPRSESTGRIPRPISKDVKGKGREQDASRPGFTRQRSNSQPVPFEARQQYAQQRQQQLDDFNPLPYSNGGQAATVGGRPQYPQQQQAQRNYSPVRPDQVRMPLRQQVNGVNVPEGGRDAGAKSKEREHVLQRRAKGGAEDKDCIIM